MTPDSKRPNFDQVQIPRKLNDLKEISTDRLQQELIDKNCKLSLYACKSHILDLCIRDSKYFGHYFYILTQEKLKYSKS